MKPSKNRLPDPKEKRLATHLLDWFKKNARDLPWREPYVPYGVWISEIMLQQTRVETVVPYYLRWMKRFPNAVDLARAPVDEVLLLWEGLGYYSRAHNLHRAARIISQDHGGLVPDDHQALLALPGIGPYTAGAISSIAFNREVPLVDANVKRVFARINDVDSPMETTGNKREAQNWARRLLPEGRARDFNQALMELGALVCTPKNPKCGACPVAGHCGALAANTVGLRPLPKLPKKLQAIQVSAGVCVKDGKILIQKRLPKGLHAGLWEFPGGKLEPGETPQQALAREFMEELELSIRVGEKITTIQHAYTKYKVTLHVLWCKPDPKDQTPRALAATELRWAAPREFDSLAFPAADRKLIEMLKEQELP